PPGAGPGEPEGGVLYGEKMASLGQLVAGVAHEINNPLNAIAGSVESLAERAAETRLVLEVYRSAEADMPAERRDKLVELRRQVDLEATLQDLDGIAKVIRRSTDRAVRI